MTQAIALAPAARAGCAASGEPDLVRLPWHAAALLLAAMLAAGALGERSAAGRCGGTGMAAADGTLPGPIGHA
jgi:hypothetical protein